MINTTIQNLAISAKTDPKALEELLSVLSKRLYYWSIKFYISGMTQEDILQELNLTLITKIVPNYDSKRSTFLSYFNMHCRMFLIGKLRNSQESMDAMNNSEPLFCPLRRDEEELNTKIKIPKSDIDLIEQEEEYQKKIKYINSAPLSKLERAVLDIHRSGITNYVLIAKRLRTTKKAVGNALDRARNKLIYGPIRPCEDPNFPTTNDLQKLGWRKDIVQRLGWTKNPHRLNDFAYFQDYWQNVRKPKRKTKKSK